MSHRPPATGYGAAGRTGDRVRADAHVAITLRDTGGLALELDGVGAADLGVLEAGLAELGLDHATVTVTNREAPAWALLARLEAAVRHAWPTGTGTLLPDAPPWSGPQGDRIRLRRSRLYLAGNEPRFALKARECGADGVILDLEDSVAPAVKLEARLLARNALRAVDFGEAERMVRINPGPMGLEDLDALVPAGPELILIPKAERAGDIQRVDERVRALEPDRTIWLMPIVETAAGVLAAAEVARASDRVAALAVGLEDLTADLGVPRTREGRETFTARSLVVLAARAAGVQAIDTVWSDLADEEGLRASVREARALGYEGKGCIHPRQVEPVHQEFAPSKEELERALQVVAAYRKAESEGSGVVALGSKMVDAPVVQRALHTVALARAMGLVE